MDSPGSTCEVEIHGSRVAAADDGGDYALAGRDAENTHFDQRARTAAGLDPEFGAIGFDQGLWSATD